MKPESVEDRKIVGQAARWVERLSDPVDAATIRELKAWIAASPKHCRYYCAQLAVDAFVREYATGVRHPADVLLALEGIDWTPNKRLMPRFRSRRTGSRSTLMAALLLIAILSSAVLWQWWQ